MHLSGYDNHHKKSYNLNVSLSSRQTLRYEEHSSHHEHSMSIMDTHTRDILKKKKPTFEPYIIESIRERSLEENYQWISFACEVKIKVKVSLVNKTLSHFLKECLKMQEIWSLNWCLFKIYCKMLNLRRLIRKLRSFWTWSFLTMIKAKFNMITWNLLLIIFE